MLPTTLLFTAAWFGLVVGLFEVVVRAVQVFVLHQWIWLSPNVVWMAPLTNVSLLVFAGCVLLVGGRFWPRLASCWTVLVVFTFIGILGPLFVIPRLHRYAVLMLACGLAVQTARMIAVRFDGFQLLVRKTALPLVVVIIVLSLSVTGWRLLETRTAVANLGAPLPGTPNVLLIVLDTVRAQSLSLYGYNRRTTPQLEQLARTGVVFERALSTSPWTLPAHATMFTGRYPYELSTGWSTPLDGTYPTLAEVFRARGYLTAAFVANLQNCTYETGLDRGFTHYEDYPVSLEMIVRSSWLGRIINDELQSISGIRRVSVHKAAEIINEDFLRWLHKEEERPFFVFLNYMDAHDPYLPPAPFDTMFGPKRPGPPVDLRDTRFAKLTQVEKDAYDGSIAYLDHQLGLLFDQLEKRGLLKNTLILVTSDHGEQFGEHGLFYHANSLYRALLHVPLLISFPYRVPMDKRIHEAVTLRDIPATIMDLVRLGGKSRFPGKSLARYWEAESNRNSPGTSLLSEVSKGINTLEPARNSKGDMKSLVVEEMHYIKNGDGREELYDFENDLLEEHDVSNTEKGRRVIEQMRASLKSITDSK